MNEVEKKLIIGSLLHDIGKVIYRQGIDVRKHGQSGYDYLKEMIPDFDSEILNCIRYHHGDTLKNVSIHEQELAYIVYMADNIAAATDRREKETAERGFEIHTPLQPVFNILNRNRGTMYYRPGTLNDGICYPQEEKLLFDEHQYSKIVCNITDHLKGMEWNDAYLNSLLEVLEANLSFVPSSTSKQELADISLFDHLKLTAAVASCIYHYLGKSDTSYREQLYVKGQGFYARKAFLLASMDLSGIQQFIYTITTKNALKTLRARSFYLEIVMEHMIDLLLERLGLSRTNLIYSGGGHCYLLIQNTQDAREIFDTFIKEMNRWFLENYQTSLYIAGAYVDCSSKELKNEPSGSYAALYRELSRKLSEQKSRKYGAEEIRWLNCQKQEDYTRECTVCRKIGKLNQDNVCPDCQAIAAFSKKILYAEFFSVRHGQSVGALKLPGGYCLVADTPESLRERMNADDLYVRAYGKNCIYTGKHIATKLWVGDYSTGSTFEEFAKTAEGIDRIGVLRVDVDNLGMAFVAGFDHPDNNNRYVTLSRTATLSRQLSMFFKYHINSILAAPQFSMQGERKEKRKAAIVYSGGDDVFIVGAWDDVIELAVDVKEGFSRYTENTLSLSGGVGIYQASYPVSAIADEVAGLENNSKNKPGKNAITLFENGGTYSWTEFEDKVIGEKLGVIWNFFEQTEDYGKAFLYNLLELISNQKERINFARYVYLLSRMEPSDRESTEKTAEKKAAYDRFKNHMFTWIHSEQDRKQLKLAINIYAYLKREREEV